MIKFIKQFVIAASLTVYFSTPVNAANLADQINSEEFLSGNAIFYALDSDIYLLAFTDDKEFKFMSQFVTADKYNYTEQSIEVQLASVKPLAKRFSSKIDILSDRSFKKISQYNGQDVDYLCFDNKKTEEGVYLQCTILHQGTDIMIPLLEIGLAKYDGAEVNPWQNDLYIEAQKEAKAKKIGIWSPLHGLFDEK